MNGIRRLVPLVILALAALAPVAARASYPIKSTQVTLGLGHTNRAIGVSALFAGCNETKPRYQIAYTKPYRGAFASVTLTEGVLAWTKCTVSGNLKSGTVYADLKKKGEINGKLAKAGKVLHGRRDPGCTGTVLIEPVKFDGTATLRFDRSKLGTVNLKRATGSIRRTNETCSGSPAPTPTALRANIGSVYVQGLRTATSKPVVTFSEAPTKVGANLYASDLVQITGKHVFTAASDLSSATINGMTPAPGSLHFTADPPCTGDPNGRTGKLTGSITAQFLFTGTVVLNGPAASSANLTRGGSPCGM